MTVSLAAHSARVCTGAYGTPISSKRADHWSESISAIRAANRTLAIACTGGVTNLANSPSTSGINMMSIRSTASSSLKKNDGVKAQTNSHTPSRQRYMRNCGDAPVPALSAPNGRKMPGKSMRIDVFIALTACRPDTVHARAVPRVARSTSAAAIAHAPSAPCS